MDIIASNRPFPNRTYTCPEDFQKIITTEQFIFFPFWSWKVPNDILESHTCIGFHTGHVNGGSPIQNLIRQGFTDTYLRMFIMNDTIDGGEIIDVAPISLLGSLEEIVIRQTEIMEEMINDYAKKNKRQHHTS